MHHFTYKDGVLHVEDVSVERIAAEIGTPFYAYSSATLQRHYHAFKNAFAPHDVLVCFAIKANSNLSVIRTLGQEGAGADAVSMGEIKRALAAGIAPTRIVYSGVGKSEQELHFAVETGIHQINVETEGELYALDAIASALGKRMPIVFRVNPDVGAGGHAKITTGSQDNKFGVTQTDIPRLYKAASTMKGVEPMGLAVHIGSQIHDLSSMEAAFIKMRALVEALRAQGLSVSRLDLGGGLGIFYEMEHAQSDGTGRIDAYAQMVLRIMNGLDVHLAFEPGRLLVGNAGILVTRVIGQNVRPNKIFLIVDAAMNDLVRPAMYEAYHAIMPVRAPPADAPMQVYDVVGPICETGDTFAGARTMPTLKTDDLIAFMSAGAYGAAMSSNYNTRCLIAEVQVKDASYACIRPRQSYEELLGQDRMAPWLF